MKKVVSNWNNYPKIFSEISEPVSTEEIVSIVNNFDSLIARGAGRSYGDASLFDTILSTSKYNSILTFDPEGQSITVQAGVLLDSILKLAVPYNLFLHVVPGTKFITVGGAIASDIHGKNHVRRGSFGEYVMELTLLNEEGKIIHVSREKNPSLFYSTFGAMGLTGIILTAKIKLKRIPSELVKKNVSIYYNLKDLLNAFMQTKSEYSIAWLDYFSFNENEINSVFQSGDFAEIRGQSYPTSKRNSTPDQAAFTMPFDLPSWFMNRLFIRTFNWLYFRLIKRSKKESLVHYESFLFPLDKIKDWNKWYGKNGFIQYQFVLPISLSFEGIEAVLKEIQNSDHWVVSCTLKRLGKKISYSPMSFPEEGFTLALDFKITNGIFEFLERLDHIVLKYKGKIYLAKDARMKSETFNKMYSKPEKLNSYFNSMLSYRLKIHAEK